MTVCLTRSPFVAAALVVSLTLTTGACSGPATTGTTSSESTIGADQGTISDLQTVDAARAAALLDAPPEDLAIIDVRTLEEYEDGHIDGAEQMDFYASDFADQIAELDRDVPYFIYCKSGNRSGQTLALMEALGFSNVTNLDGGMQAWTEAGYQARS